MDKIAANSLKAFRTSTILMFLNVLLKCQYLIVQPENEQESCYFPLCSVVIFGRHLKMCMCDLFFFSFFLSFSFFPKVPFFLFIIFTVYTMLPFGMRGAVIISVISALSHIIVLSIVVSMTSQENKESIIFQVRKYYLVK